MIYRDILDMLQKKNFPENKLSNVNKVSFAISLLVTSYNTLFIDSDHQYFLLEVTINHPDS